MPLNLLKNLQRSVKQAKLEIRQLPICPEISLHLLSEDYPRERLPDEEALAIIKSPAYWAFCWASGQVTARYLLDNPQICENKVVLDFGSGSGIAGIAAAMAGASKVIACDSDGNALEATLENAKLNNIQSVEVIKSLNEVKSKADLFLAADVLYDRENLDVLNTMSGICYEAIVADSRIRDKNTFSKFKLLLQKKCNTVPDLDEFEDFCFVSLYRAKCS